jgi:hypothetical protein
MSGCRKGRSGAAKFYLLTAIGIMFLNDRALA